jgi:hypothetical protein
MDNIRKKIIKKENELSAIKNNIRYYNKLHLNIMKMDAVMKIRQYGVMGYSEKYLKSPNGIVVSKLKSYIYSKDMERYLNESFHSCLSELEYLKSIE